ncbi:MAG: Outer membrane protein OprM [Chlamydiia bacterium]|nr:Outer membrane protein OprM [Chlamydiia bacterium]
MRRKLILICVLFTSCLGKGEKVSLTKDISLTKTVKEALDTDLFAEGDYPDQNWYEEFRDDCLSCLIKTALARNPGLNGLKKRVDVANETAMMTRSKLFPEISGVFQYLWLYLTDAHFLQEILPDSKQNSFLYNLLFNFTYEFDFWMKNQKKYKAALGTMHATRMQYEQSKLILTTSIAKSYFTLVAMKSKKEVIEQMLSKKEKHSALIELRKKNRIDNEIQAQSSKQNVKGIQEALLAVNSEILLQQSLINILIGVNPENEVKTKKPYEVVKYKLELPEKITTTLLSRRPDLLSSLWVTKKNALEIGVAVTEFLPDVTIMEAPALVTNKGENLFKGDSFANLLFPEITQPLFTGGRLLANWRKSKDAYEASVYEFNDLFLKAAKDVRDTVIKFTETIEREEVQRKKLELAKKNYKLEFLRFSHGVSSMISVLKFDEVYLENKALLIERERQKAIAYISFINSLGGGFKETEKEEKERNAK